MPELNMPIQRIKSWKQGLSVFMISIFSAEGQEAQPLTKGLSTNLSLAIPVSTFASLDRTNDESGYALPGLALDLSYLVIGKSPFGFLSTIRYASFGYDIDYQVDARRSSAPPGTWYGEGENWKMVSMMLGGYFDPVRKEDFALSVRAQVGWLFLMPKDRYVSGMGSGGTYNVIFDYHNEPANSFTYLVGFNIRSRISPRVIFTAGVDYLNAAPEVTYSFMLTQSSVVTQNINGTFTQPINAILVSGGFIFLF